MADNPLKPDAAREHRIRERAYHLWEQDGRPHGRDQEYWERARELIGLEDNPDAGELPNPMSEPDSPRETGVEEAEIQENLGEFPDRFADQGEWQQTPSAAHSARTHKPAGAAAAAEKRARNPAETATTAEKAPRKVAAKQPASPKSAAPKPQAAKAEAPRKRKT